LVRHWSRAQLHPHLSPLRIRTRLRPTLFPYTTLFRSQWAHNSPAGTDGFVFVMRVPFKDVLAATPTKVASGTLPEVTTIQELYTRGTPLDFDRLWVDVASLSNNLYESEHEISKYGYVRAEQI